VTQGAEAAKALGEASQALQATPAGGSMKKVPDGPPPPFLPASYELADITSVQALAAGTADAHQQQRAVRWIIEAVCDTYGLGWHPDGDHASSFVAGRRFSGCRS
jgi:hypothetical protein